MSDIDKEIAEFHNAARRRKAVIYAVAGALMIAVGAVILVVAFWAGDSSGLQSTRYPVKIIAAGGAFVVFGLTALYNAYRIGSGQVNDVEYDPGR